MFDPIDIEIDPEPPIDQDVHINIGAPEISKKVVLYEDEIGYHYFFY